MKDTTQQRGTPVVIGEDTYYVPPMTLGLVRKYEKELKDVLTMTPMTSFGTLAAAIPMFTDVLKGNYPNLTEDEVGNLLDLDNVAEVLAAIVGSMAVKKKAIPLGEMQPVPAAASTGSGSTAGSSPQPDGPTPPSTT